MLSAPQLLSCAVVSAHAFRNPLRTVDTTASHQKRDRNPSTNHFSPITNHG